MYYNKISVYIYKKKQIKNQVNLSFLVKPVVERQVLFHLVALKIVNHIYIFFKNLVQ